MDHRSRWVEVSDAELQRGLVTLSTGQLLFGFIAGVGLTLMIAHSILENDIKRWDRSRAAMEAASERLGPKVTSLYDWRRRQRDDMDAGDELP